MLRKIGVYNDVSPELLPPLPEKGTVVTYRFTALRFDPLTKKAFFANQVKIPPTSTFFDSIKKGWVQLGLVDAVDTKGEATKVERIWARPMETAGHFTVIIGSGAASDRLFQYLELASFVNSRQEIRNEDEAILLERVDFDAEASNKRKEKYRSMEAYAAAQQLEGEDFKRLALLLGFYVSGATDKNNIIRKNIEDFAERKPEEFFAYLKDPFGDAKAIINHALLIDVVYQEDFELKWKDTKAVLMPLSQEGNVANQFAKWLSENKTKGNAILNELRSLVEEQANAIAARNAKKK